ncbi:TMEM165/GDT1 family protein [Pseudanabaena galeata UHCC 0370]|uniref:GDT1 family protein n=1 Tax=Pseudanabaena galeata UHCC 0370 TaxID=3110310 RepID=A0ABU5TLF1_9CYAN|nr:MULTISPECIES: TMEM165/GDT1 family protein [Pseudanabaena]MEA5478833.1 TMEM165/GDT1 family protein [Pseudanabaena galeata UHCC 0370]MEA5485714.1 TMEM165/GDT1 family protein [Pseudanabaena sp. CCNP1317]WGS72059.1 TMEM165/GDT1 family protein [Pseudanabaena galeata CCNP1313]
MLQAFTASLLLITISELGDKTFFIAVILSMRYDHRTVFSSVLSALALMTVLSVLLGQAVSLLPKTYTHYGAIALFLIFGVKLIIDAIRMSPNATEEVVKEAEETVREQDHQIAIPLFGKMLARYPQIGIWIQAFVMTFLAEWGDRTQISTIALAAANDPVFVTLGAILGHGICTVIAVIGGRMVAGRISERVITGIGGVLFLIFGVTAYFQA